MADFPHLKLPFKIEGIIKPGRGFPADARAKAITDANRANRGGHGTSLNDSASLTIKKWEDLKALKSKEGLKLPNENDIPVFLKIDTSAFKIDSLVNWGIEVISEEQDGYIIGASQDGLKLFKENLSQFLKEEGRYKNTAAKIWEFVTDDSWRLTQLLKGEIGDIWDQIDLKKQYILELGVSCNVPNVKEYPNAVKYESELAYQKAIEEFKAYEQTVQIERDLKQIEREKEVEEYVKIYNGELYEIWDTGTDALYFKVSISGQGLKDIVQAYQYLFEAKLDSKYFIDVNANEVDDNYELEVVAPDENAPLVCVIDSGIQEDHRLISAAIDRGNSRSYVDGDNTPSDYAKNSGHGTKVAGAILYPNSIPTTGRYKLESRIQNAKILDANCEISTKKFAPALLEQIQGDFSSTTIFNLSVTSFNAYNGTHMPALAAAVDKISHEKNVLFIVAAGNLKESSNESTNPGIQQYFEAGVGYPAYLNEKFSKIANPGVSYFAITVGSIAKNDFENDDYKAIAGKDQISPFSRTGPGMWGCIKPDVVEFGGDLAKNKGTTFGLIRAEEMCPELVQSTYHGANAVGKYSNGTSFSAPKVSYIASKLKAEHPLESAQMYRALIIQSARLPEHCFHNPTNEDIRHYGYGVPSLDRALNNYERRITFIRSGQVGPKKADIYRLNIPAELRGEGRTFRILAEVTLTFTAKTRLTRKGSHSYLSNWLEWQSSKYNESFKGFRNRTIDYIEGGDEEAELNPEEQDLDAMKWCLRENSKWADNGINRNYSTAQKSWVIIEPHQFADEFSIAVIGHLGWDRSLENQIEYSLCVSFEALDTEMNIYNIMAEAQVETEIEAEL